MKPNRTLLKSYAGITVIAAGLGLAFASFQASGEASETNGAPSDAAPARMAMMHGRGSGAMMGRGVGAGMQRHMYYMRNGLPAAYSGKSNPLTATADIVRAGAELFRDNCASCHGARGLGDGEAGRDLRPRPANLTRTTRMPMLTDAYLLWTIMDGGERFGSAMPALKETLSEDEVWKIITAMRAGFPEPK